MLRAALVAVALLACSGCSHDGDGPPPSPPASPSPSPSGDPVVHVDDDGKTFELTKGGTLTFKLASHGGTGYAWTLVSVDPKVLAQQGEATSEVEHPGLPGGPKLDVLKFTAVGAGSTTAELALKRAFGNDGPAKVVRVQINVK